MLWHVVGSFRGIMRGIAYVYLYTRTEKNLISKELTVTQATAGHMLTVTA